MSVYLKQVFVSIIFLIGPRGCGKSLMARLLERQYGCRVCDTDELIRAATGKTVAELVEEGGWEAFRAAEKEALAEAVAGMANAAGAQSTAVVATGGGMVLAPENRARMRHEGTVIYLAAPLETLVARLSRRENDPARPSLSGLPLEAEVAKVLEERGPLYRDTAHHALDASRPPEDVARDIYETVILPARRDKDGI